MTLPGCDKNDLQNIPRKETSQLLYKVKHKFQNEDVFNGEYRKKKQKQNNKEISEEEKTKN